MYHLLADDPDRNYADTDTVYLYLMIYIEVEPITTTDITRDMIGLTTSHEGYFERIPSYLLKQRT